MKKTLVTWWVLMGLLLQSAAWAVPAQRAGQAERLAHEIAHALDHGHHAHADGFADDAVPHGDAGHEHAHVAHSADPATDTRGHEVDPALQLPDAPSPAAHGPHHSHASDAGQVQGLPVAAALPGLSLPRVAPGVEAGQHPPSADPDGLLRPPQATA